MSEIKTLNGYEIADMKARGELTALTEEIGEQVKQGLTLDPTNTTVIEDGTDFDTITSIGNYRITSAASALTMINCPLETAGRLTVITPHVSTRPIQIVIGSDPYCPIHIRFKSSEGWEPWNKVLSTSDVKQDVGTSITNTISQNAIKNLLNKRLELSDTNVSLIANNTDLNDIVVSGNYIIPENVTLSHSPVSGIVARLYVVTSATVNFQYVVSNTGEVFHRAFNGSSWTQWSTIQVVLPPPPMVTFIDDDGATTFIDEMLPLIEKHNVPISSPITTQRVGTTSGSITFMDWEQIKNVFLAGGEILNHTYNHHAQVDINAESPSAPQYTQAELEMQYIKAKNALIGHGISGGDILVLNNISAEQERVQKAASHTVRCAFRSYGSKPIYTTSDPFHLPRYPLEPLGTDAQAITNANLKSILDVHAKRSTGWLVFIFHTDDSGWTSEHTAVIDYAIDYAKNTLGLPIVTADYGCRKYIEHQR